MTQEDPEGYTIGPKSRKASLEALADRLESPEWRDRLVDAYLKDTAFLRRDIVRREVEIPAALLRLPRSEETLLEGRRPMGRVAVMMPRNSLGFTLAKAVAGSYLAGNDTIVYFPGSLQQTAPVYGDLLTGCLDNVRIAPMGQSSALFIRSCLRDPEIKAVVIYGDDSWIDSYIPLARETGTKIIFEGPGNDPLVVMPDANLDEAVEGAVACGLNNGGQSCSAIERFFIHEDVLDAFRKGLIDRLKDLQPGDPAEEGTRLGPIASKAILSRMLRQIEESVAEGATLALGGEVTTESRTGLPIVRPVVLTDCRIDMPVVRNETFGPVFPLIAFRDTDELLAALAATRYGLNASLYGTAPREVVEYLEGSHRNFYIGSTSVSPGNLPSRLLDGGFGRSGMIWDFSVDDQPRSGRRTIALELSLPPDTMSSNTTPSRIPPRPIEDMKPEWLEILARIPGDGLKGKYAPVNVLGMLMYNPDTLGQFLDYWVNAKLKMGLTVREQELVILRMGVLYDCEYVWKHHVPVGREFGITEAEFDALKQRPLPAVFNPREEALLVLTDEMMDRRNVNDALYAKYRDQLSDSELVDLISLVSQYVLFALTNNVLRVQVEPNLDDIPGLRD